MTTDLFRSQHAQIMLRLIQLDGFLSAELAADAFRQMLAELHDRLGAHTVAEEGFLYPCLRACSDSVSRELAERFQAEMDCMSQDFRSYIHRWLTADAIESRPADFIRETRAMTAALLERIRRENAQLLPLADRFSGRRRRIEPRWLQGRRCRALPVLPLASDSDSLLSLAS